MPDFSLCRSVARPFVPWRLGGAGVDKSAMASYRFLRERLLLRRLLRRYREVALAVMLTVAAVAFIAAAFLRGEVTSQVTSSSPKPVPN